MSDLIDRQAAIDEIKVVYEWHDVVTQDRLIEHLKELPSAQPERKTGWWIWDDEGYHCSECLFHAYGNTLECLDGTYRYCPNCGASMTRDGE